MCYYLRERYGESRYCWPRGHHTDRGVKKNAPERSLLTGGRPTDPVGRLNTEPGSVKHEIFSFTGAFDPSTGRVSRHDTVVVDHAEK